jgi:probable DNA metabolism protein
MSLYLYDGSFEGFLSVIFTAFAEKDWPTQIQPQDRAQLGLLDLPKAIETDQKLAERVLEGLDKRTEQHASALVYRAFLSEKDGIEMILFHFIQAIIRGGPNILSNFANPHIGDVLQINKMIGREVHRMHAFVRFQKTQDNLFFAVIEPDFNVLPLLGDHFSKRYADQKWIIFDTQRHYGLLYDLHETLFIDAFHPQLPKKHSSPLLSDAHHNNALPGLSDTLDDHEGLYQQLWVQYFDSVNIKERKNTKLHMRHMPKRYWKYLTEKKFR